MTIYIKNKCILELGLGIPEIDFGECYEKMINSENSLNGELIIAIIDKKIDSKNNKKIIKYGMFSPLTGKYLNSDDFCKEDKITLIDNIENKLLEAKVNLEILKDFVNEGIDIFNMSSPFYNDICFQYNSKKDIALKDRVLEYFPNITLCEEGCELLGINMSTVTAICECYYSESKREDNIKNKVMEQTQIGLVEDIISSSNIYVVKCINLVLKKKTAKKCYGGFIMIGLISIEIICAIIYCKNNIYSINKYIFSITNKYIGYLHQKNHQNITLNENANKINEPPNHNKRKSVDNTRHNVRKYNKKSKTKRKTEVKGHFNFIFNNNNDKNKNNINDNKHNHHVLPNQNKMNYPKNYQVDYIYKSKNHKDFSYSSEKFFVSQQKSQVKNDYDNLFFNINDNLDININDYIKNQYDEMDFDEAIRKDHRKFCACYVDKLKDNQIIINTFCSDEPIKPKSIKVLFLIFQLDLYFFINGLFYDEEYISKIYHLEKDTFFTMAERFFDNLIYAALAGIIINYIIEFFFIEEKKIKKILKIEKDNILILKYEMVKILKSIKTRYLLFIIISLIVSLIALVHTLCFNIVYFHTMPEWIVFSLIIILSMQMLSFVIYFLQTALRFISFKFKSEKLFNLSL